MTINGKVLWSYPRHTGLERGPWLEMLPGVVRIYYDYEEQSGGYRWGCLQFDKVRAVRFIGEAAAPRAQRPPIDTLVEITDSPWPDQIKQEELKRYPGVFDLRHYCVFLYDEGQCDIAAVEWSCVPLIAEPPKGTLLDLTPPHLPAPPQENRW